MMTPLAYNWCQRCGEMYSPCGGGNNGVGNQCGVTTTCLTVTLNEQLAVPLTLLAVQVTVVVPTGKVLPLGGVQDDVTVALQVSTGPTVGAKVTTLPAGETV